MACLLVNTATDTHKFLLDQAEIPRFNSTREKTRTSVITMLKDYFFVRLRRNERISRGKKMLAEYLKNVDMDKVASLVAEQVKLVGGKTTYDVRL